MSRIRATNVLCAKAERQQQMFYVRQQQNVGHEGVVTGRDDFSLRST
ncbi:hypothetical protein [Lysinibacillus sphaericus]|nr:hypothetical protein [Lysinibacillus sphaericus]